MNKTIAKIGYALITKDSADKITYGNVVWFDSTKSGGREITADPNGEPTTIYADGLPVVTAEDNAGYNIKLQLLSIVDDIETDWFGNIKTADGSIIEKNDTAERPRFALLAAKERFASDTVYEIDTYLNCIASKRSSRSDKTSEGKLDPQFPEIEIAATPRLEDKYIRVTSYADSLPTTVTVPTVDAVDGE